MSGEEMIIKGSLFGGYNKKQTKTYITELQKMITDLQTESDDILDKCEKLKKQLEEAENCYKTLWETCKEQEETIEKLTGEIQEQENALDLQKQKYLTLEQKYHESGKMERERIRKILEKIKSLVEPKSKKSFKKLDKFLEKQFEKMHEKEKV